eukprot:CCRYP_012897-RA/>CCRYP_012897-RA protein AED:0.03 eAED:0.03 QI:0/1/1/1/1/1/2/862/229
MTSRIVLISVLYGVVWYCTIPYHIVLRCIIIHLLDTSPHFILAFVFNTPIVSTNPTTNTMISCTTTSFLLFAIGAIIPPATMAFSVAFVSNANPHRGAKLHYYLGEDGYAGFPREFPMDQYAPSPMDQYAPSPMDQYTPSAMEFEAVVYDRAVDCAHNPGMCNLDELMDLARGETSLFEILLVCSKFFAAKLSFLSIVGRRNRYGVFSSLARSQYFTCSRVMCQSRQLV